MSETEQDRVWITDHNGVRLDCSSEEFLTAIVSPWLSAAWTPSDLCLFADRWEREAAEKASREQEVDELAKAIRRNDTDLDWGELTEYARDVWRNRARAVLDAGYRKADQ